MPYPAEFMTNPVKVRIGSEGLKAGGVLGTSTRPALHGMTESAPPCEHSPSR